MNKPPKFSDKASYIKCTYYIKDHKDDESDILSIFQGLNLENKFQNFNKASNMKSSNSDVL